MHSLCFNLSVLLLEGIHLVANHFDFLHVPANCKMGLAKANVRHAEMVVPKLLYMVEYGCSMLHVSIAGRRCLNGYFGLDSKPMKLDKAT